MVFGQTGAVMFVTLKTRVFADATGVYSEIPGILTPVGWLMPLIDYFVCHRHDRSRTWMVKVARSVTLFLEYMAANPREKNGRQLFQNFGQRLYTGTFDRYSGLDPSWLCWLPMSGGEAAKTLARLSDFFEWLGTQSPQAAKVNPRYSASAFDRLMDEAAFQFRRDKAFLGHAWAAHSTAEAGGFGTCQRL